MTLYPKTFSYTAIAHKPHLFSQYTLFMTSGKINKIVLLCFLVVSILSSILPKATCFTILNLYCAFFSVLPDQNSQQLCLHLEDNKYIWIVIPQGLTEAPPYFPQVLNQDLKDLNFTCDLVLMQYMQDQMISTAFLRERGSL